MPKGILLHGPPGTGKTLLAKAVAHESGATFFSQSAASFVEMFVGVGAARIRHLFKAARKKSPAIVFIDELDAVGGHRGFDVSGERDQTLNQLLVEMDGFTARKEVVVIAASNLLEKLDPALLRPGRFDRQIFVSPPDVGGRERILHVHSRNKPLADGVDLRLLARQTSGLTGADLANICNEAAIFAARRGVDRLEMRDFDAALERVVAGMQSHRTLTDHEKRVVAYHEAGHALCSELLPSVDRVHRISIVPRGRALGYTLNLPEEDRYLKTREELIDFMTMLLGGRAAEQLVFGSITTGASDDLKRVAEIARAMVHEYAMGTASGSMRASRRRRRRGHPPGTRRRGPRAGRRGLPGRPEAGRRPPRAARRAGPHAADERGARASRHRPDHGPRAARRPAPDRRAVGGGRHRGQSGTASRAQVSCLGCSRRSSTTSAWPSSTIDAALALYRDVLGMPLVHRETVSEQGVDAALLDIGDGHIELLQPLGPDTAVGKFLARRGPGLHHVAYRVASVEETLQALSAAGVRLIDERPRTGIRGSQVAFLHPASTGGVLTEIVQPRHA